MAAPVRFSTYNVLDLFGDESAGERERYGRVVESIRALNTDVLAVQEIRAASAPDACRRLRRLAADTGLNCLVKGPDGGEPEPAAGLGARGYHLGLLWRDGIEPVPGSYQTRNTGLWHGLAWVTLDVGGAVARHVTFHATPFGRRMRILQNEVLVAAVTTGPDRPPVLVGADWNAESADRVQDERTGAWRLYEPGDPYAGADWFPDLIHQCEWDYDERGRRRHRVDRTAGDVLWAGGLHDAAAVLRAPWQASTGHHPDDPYGARGIRRRIDAVRVTAEVVPALRSHRVTDNELTRQVSDHLPVTVEYDPAAIAAGPGPGQMRPAPAARG